MAHGYHFLKQREENILLSLFMNLVYENLKRIDILNKNIDLQPVIFGK